MKKTVEKNRDFNDKRLIYAEFLQREEGRYHHGYDEEMLQYRYITLGDMRSIKESQRMFRNNINGKLSNDPIRHLKYLFVASTTLACRAAINGGIEPQVAYNISDLFIQTVDGLHTVNDIFDLQTNMISQYTQKVIDAKEEPYSYAEYRPEIEKVIDYIFLHLHEKILISDLAEYVGLSPSYLSALFKKQTGHSIGDYIMAKKVEAASNMLLHSDYSLTEIGNILGFCSTSHFIEMFKRLMGNTPSSYRRKAYKLKST